MNAYNIKVVTSNIKNAGTNAKVYIELYGRAGRSGLINLESSSKHRDKFEQGNTDSFDIQCKDVGPLTKIRIGHNNAGIGAGWHLKEVHIESLADGRKWICECNNWLANDEGDGKTERELPAVEIRPDAERFGFRDPYKSSKRNEPPPNVYKIHVTTSNKPSAGTNAKVYIELFGRNERSGIINLESSTTHRDKFEAGKTDVFEVNCRNVGSLTKIRIGHNNAGFKAGWHLKEVMVESVSDGRKWLCECNNWLADDEGDRKIERELPAIEIRPDSERFGFKDPYKSNKHHEQGLYKIHVTTSKKQSAGTNAKVYIELIGRKERSGAINLESSSTHRNKFEAGNTDVFEVNCKNVGSLTRVRIGHNNAGFKAGWHLKEVIIESLTDGRRWLCECNNWLADDEGDGKVERELPAIEIQPADDMGSRDKHKFRGNCNYKIYVTTSNIASAGTDAHVFIQIFGRQEFTDKIILKSSALHKNTFEKGNTDYFEVDAPNVGDIKKIRIGHDNKGMGPGWHLKSVVIQKDDGRSWEFPCNQWLDKREGDGQIERELFPENPDGSRHKDHKHARKRYVIEVFTGDVPKAGTDANVYLTLFGERNESPEIHLRESETHRDMFERDHMDRFYVDDDGSEDLGELVAIRIRHDNQGRHPEWFLDRVEIIDSETKNKYIFECKNWLALKKYDSKIDRIIKEKKKLEKEKQKENEQNKKKKYIPIKKQYFIKIYTKCKKNSLVEDPSLSIKLFGDRYQTRYYKYLKSKTHDSKFASNQIDLFVIETSDDLGTIYAMKLKLTSVVDDISDLGFEKIEIEVDDLKYFFYFDHYIRERVESNKVELLLLEHNAEFL